MHAPGNIHAQRGILRSSKPAVFQLLFLLINIVLFSTLLRAQQSGVRIKERVVITPRQSPTDVILQTGEKDSIITLVSPFDGTASLTIDAYTILEIDTTSLAVNGELIFDDIFKQTGIQHDNIPLGHFRKGENLTFILRHNEGLPFYGRPWLGDIYPGYEDECFIDYGLHYTGLYDTYVMLYVGFADTTTARYLKDDWDGLEVTFGEPVLLNAQYANACYRDWYPVTYPLPEGTTFTFTITEGGEYADLSDPIHGGYGDTLTGIPQNNGGCSVYLNVIEIASDPEYVTVEARTTATGVNSCSGRIKINPIPTPDVLVVAPTKLSLSYGDTLRLDVGKISNGSLVPLETGTTYTYTITEGNNAGYLYSPDSSQSGDVINGDFSSAVYAAVEETPQENTTQVTVQVQATEPGGGVISSLKPPKMKENLEIKTTGQSTNRTISFKREIHKAKVSNAIAGSGGSLFGAATFEVNKLDHFAITVKPDTGSTKDTVAFTEGAKLIITAQDKDSNEVTFDANSLLKISLLSNEEYGTFINANKDTLHTTPVILNDILYSDAKNGKIKFAAIKKNPDTLVTCRVRVELQNDTSMKGDTSIVVVEQTLKIVMDTPYVVRPSIPTEDLDMARVRQRREAFEIKMTRGGKSVANHPFKLFTDYIIQSGGHEHGDTRNIRRDNNDDNYGHFTVGQQSRHRRPFDTLTNGDGKLSINYNASIFGDTMKIYLKSRCKPLLIDSLKVKEKVDSLINFRNVAANSKWTFSQSPTGATRHSDNNWCMPEMQDSLKNGIGKFYEWSKEDFGTTITLSLNDMSLILGGRFDMSGKWDGRNSQAHLYHRTGKSVDINEPTDDSCKIKHDLPKGKWEWTKVGNKLKDIFEKSSLFPEYERYIHFELKKK